ncbi:uncharacterized protein OCT59_010538 [Rhizophagus irregularis]|uniref:uncharacterized protein n=1 Tax=Rhizophagus irregularis TaxID=588596 RepID=UPI00331CB999|nr:hypothetical protein OCT59_010538 [Rhizophagus irregularis]
MIGHINTIQDEASDILVLGKRDNLRRLKSDLGVGDNIENGGLTKSPYEDQENKESVGSTKKAKTTKDTLSSSHGVPKPSSSAGVTKPFSSSLESAINSPEPRTPPHRIFSYGTSSGSSVCKEHGSKDDTSEDDLLMKSPVDITVDCKLIVKNMCVRSKMEQWRRSSRYVEEIHKQDDQNSTNKGSLDSSRQDEVNGGWPISLGSIDAKI